MRHKPTPPHLALLACLSVSAPASAATLSGTILRRDSTALPNVTVRLASGPATVSDASGNWTLATPASGLGSVHSSPSKAITGHINLTEGRLQVAFDGTSASGRRQSAWQARAIAHRAIAPAGRASENHPDTLIYTLNRKVFLRDTITLADQQGIVRIYDTSYNPAITYGYVRDRQNRLYRTVRIDSLEWMAQNLESVTDSSWLFLDSKDSGYKYGRLYSWTAAMGLADSCRSRACADQIESEQTGICPTDWHVPSDDEWYALGGFVSSKDSLLKSSRGWYENGNGSDKFGFAALPGGYREFNGQFTNNLTSGFWWSATPSSLTSAYRRGFDYGHSNIADRPENLKSLGFSIRCVKRVIYPVIKSVVIGTQTWMVDNLSVKTNSSWWYGGSASPDSAKGYGRLYSWTAAMALPDSCNTKSCSSLIEPKHRGICPSGWHIPSASEWEVLSSYANKSGTLTANVAGAALRSVSGWITTNPDSLGFKATPTGYRDADGNYHNAGQSSFLWVAAQTSATNAIRRGIDGVNAGLYNDSDDKTFGFSVRCLKD